MDASLVIYFKYLFQAVEETKSALNLHQHVIQTLENVTIAIMVMTEDGCIKCVGITAMCVELMDCVFLEEV